MGLLFRLIVFIFQNRWLRTIALLAIGYGLFTEGNRQVGEAEQFKRGPTPISIEAFQKAAPRQKYVTLTGLSDSFYAYEEITNTNHGIETGKDYTLYYAMMTEIELAMILGKKKPHVSVIAEDRIDDSKEDCIKKENCLEIGTRSVTGLLQTIVSYQEAADLLAKDYVVDSKTFYLDSNWRPATNSNGIIMRLIGLAFMIGGVVSGSEPKLFKRRSA